MNLDSLPIVSVFHSSVTRKAPQSEYLMIVMHGRGDSPDGFTWMPRALAIPQMNYLMLEAPDPYYDGFSWYDLPPNRLPGIVRSRQLLEEVFTELYRQGFQSERIFLFGFSQGCVMTLEFGGRHAKKFAGYLGISGNCYDPDVLAKEATSVVKSGDWLITHGKADDVIPFEATREQMMILKQGGFHLDFREYEKSHTIDDAEELPQIRAWLAGLLEKNPLP